MSNGLVLKYEYDRLGRIVNIIYPDASSVAYVYQGSNLVHIIRKDPQGQQIYAHDYDYDLSGNVVKAKLAGQAGTIDYTYNLLNQPTRIAAPTWEERITSYDNVGNLRERTIPSTHGYSTNLDYWNAQPGSLL